MSSIAARTLKGFRDTLPEDMAPQRAMLRTIETTFAVHGFGPLDTPALEYAEILTGKYGDEGEKLLYRFKDHGERDVALRYDLTVPLARVMAQYGGVLPSPFRRYQIGKVWRADKPQRGRFREFMQCDADICGSDSAMADAEVVICGLSVLRALGISDFRLHLNHRGVLRRMLDASGIGPDRQAVALRCIDKLDKVGQDGVTRELAAAGFDASQSARLLELVELGVNVGDELGDNEDSARLSDVLTLVQAAGLAEHIVFDPGIARGLDYYTGVIYETRLTDPRVASMGAVMSGGRYDGLIGMFGKQTVPAVGISLGLSRLLAALRELELVSSDGAAADVFVTVFGPAQAAASVRAAQVLRAAGISVELSLKAGKLGKQFAQADRRGCRIAIVIGPDEAAAAQARVKDLRSGDQTVVDLAALAEAVQGGLESKS